MTRRQQSEMFDLILLDHAGAVQDLSVAYGLAKDYFGDTDDISLQLLVKESLERLIAKGHIVLFRASRERGYGLHFDSVEPLTRAAAITEIDLGPEHIPDEEDMAFFVATPSGRARFASLAPGTVPRI